MAPIQTVEELIHSIKLEIVSAATSVRQAPSPLTKNYHQGRLNGLNLSLTLAQELKDSFDNQPQV